MPTMNVSLPQALRDFVETQVSERGFGSTSEFVRDLIRREQDRVALRERILEGAESPLGPRADGPFFDALYAALHEGSVPDPETRDA